MSRQVASGGFAGGVSGQPTGLRARRVPEPSRAVLGRYGQAGPETGAGPESAQDIRPSMAGPSSNATISSADQCCKHYRINHDEELRRWDVVAARLSYLIFALFLLTLGFLHYAFGQTSTGHSAIRTD